MQKGLTNHGKADAGIGWKNISFGKHDGEMRSCLMSGSLQRDQSV